jgi:hypothetical protein
MQFNVMRANAFQLLILTIRPLLFEAVKSATTSRYLRGRFFKLELPHQDKIHESAIAARQNIRICQQVMRLRHPATLSVSTIHYCFNAALSLELHSILSVDEPPTDRERISLTQSILDADQGSNAEFANDCAKVLADLVSIMKKLRSGPFQHQDEVSSLQMTVTTLPQDMQSNSGWTMVPSQIRRPSLPEQEPGDTDCSHLQDERDSAYAELVSWLQHDSLQSTVTP